MELVLEKGFFQELALEESILIDGGVDWNFVGQTMSTVGGAYIGAKVGASIGFLGGPVGSVVGGIVGGVAGAVIYSLWD